MNRRSVRSTGVAVVCAVVAGMLASTGSVGARVPTASSTGASDDAGLEHAASQFGAGNSFDTAEDIDDLESVRYWGSYSGDPCPNAKGTVRVSVEVRMVQSAPGLDGTSVTLASSVVSGPIVIDVTDNAEIENVDFKGTYRSDKGGFDGARANLVYHRAIELVDATVANQGPFEKAEITARADRVAKRAARMADVIATRLAKVWQDGASCVTLKATPGSKSVKPRAQFKVRVNAKAKDGTSPGKRPITGRLDGPTSIDPKESSGSQGTFTYIAPAKKGEKGHIRFEQRSKRGVGQAVVEYRVGGKLTIALDATKVVDLDVTTYDGTPAELTGLSVTIDPPGDGSVTTATGVASLHARSSGLVGANVTDPLFAAGTRNVISPEAKIPTCSVEATQSVPMKITVRGVGDGLVVSAVSARPVTLQSCNNAGAFDVVTTITFGPVTVDVEGGTNSSIEDAMACLTGLDEGLPTQAFGYTCTYTIVATPQDD